MSSDDYILVTDSRRLDVDPEEEKGDDAQESTEAFDHTLKKQGITIEEGAGAERGGGDRSRDLFTRELLKESGIEIVAEDPDEDGSLS